MYEVELKVRADHERVRSRLSELDAESVGVVQQVDTYYGHPIRNFAETDEALRIRHETAKNRDQARITYKGPLVESESKTRAELETPVADGDTLTEILEKLGFEPAATVEKTRERFRIGDYTVTLDTVSDLGEFLEVETEAEVIEPAREGAIELLERLGFAADDQIRASYLGLLLEAAD